MKSLPNETYDFKKLVSKNAYVDKTRYFYKLIVEDDRKLIFASRPRRFGKSLTVSALKYLFSGDKEDFKGTYIYDTDYDFKKYPILRFDMSNYRAKNPDGLEAWLLRQVRYLYSDYQIQIDESADFSEAFAYLIRTLGKREQVVILIDEYDKPITDNIFNAEGEAYRTVLSSFYQNIKTCDEYIRFVFITGVSKFSKLSLFSTLNNLTDISYDERYAEMFGYTQRELEENFAEYIDEGIKNTGLSKEEYLGRLKEQYDGYKFHEKGESVYNPVSVGTFFYKGGYAFDNYWIETGSSSFLFNIAKKVDFSILDDLPVSSSLDFASYDILNLAEETVSKDDLVKLLLQTGYLTIKGYDGYDVILDFPNLEVASSFTLSLIKAYGIGNAIDLKSLNGKTRLSLTNGETEKAIDNFKAFFASFPYDVISKGEKLYEVFYQTALFSFLRGMGECVALEEKTNRGRIDMALTLRGEIYIFELKLDKTADVAIDQIKERGYFEKYASEGKRIHLVGLNFSSSARNIESFEEEIIFSE